ncbi:uncharacterized protein (DUF885 family) [Brevibacterium sanguinis]|uniref:Uncharacterized protein (DUF885 family) n=2 Tax=Brevibacterium TaxID=1696 RepID=A0A366IIZ7_9MICO|nr:MULTISPECIES: DUF885 family protein [Brevibacterium]RBP63599.1 uncharacterized protein (DUF885 family) [Brevibacterium sanguinis]RBP70258.1 uncharacterized protein (DUF885 family) [Brevibacterium celere]
MNQQRRSGTGTIGKHTPANANLGRTNEGQRLYEIIDAEWKWRETEFGSLSQKAVARHFLPDISPASQERRTSKWREVRQAIDSIDRALLNDDEALDLDVYSQQLNSLLEAQEHRMWERPATADSAFWRTLAFDAYRLVLGDEESARAYLGLLRDIPRYFEQQISNMRDGVARGFGPARVCMLGREEPVRSVAEVSDVRSLPFFGPFDRIRWSGREAERDSLQAEALEVLTSEVVPAYGKLHRFLVTEYLPELPESIAAADQPDGLDFYCSQVREYSTTELDPQEIFDLGMTEVRKIRVELEETAAEVGFADDLDGLFHFMRTEPRFYAMTPRQLLAEAAYTCKAFDRVIHQYFGKLPEQRFAVMETPSEIAPFDTFGRGAPDRYLLNTYNLPARPLYSLPALTLHESAPGHSFQISLAEELDLPDFRRLYISAFGEGWGLYTERLGDEMGIYETPYERIGMLSFQMWRAVRLVVDPGMHVFGWSRQQAQDFLRENTAIAEHEIVTEIDRYISWPGQATAYYLGLLTIQRLRREAEEALEEDFNIRDFHDTILGLGSVPLTVLEAQVRRYIAAAA